MANFIIFLFILLLGFGFFLENDSLIEEEKTLSQIQEIDNQVNRLQYAIPDDQEAFNSIVKKFVIADRDLISEIRAIEQKEMRELVWNSLIQKRGERWAAAKPDGVIQEYFGQVISIDTSKIWGGENDGRTRLNIAVKGYGSGAVYKSDGWASIILEKNRIPPHWLRLKAGDTVKFSGVIFIKRGDPAYFEYHPKIGSRWPAFSFNFSEIVLID